MKKNTVISAMPATMAINKFSVFVLDTFGINRIMIVITDMISMDAITVKNNFRIYNNESLIMLFWLIKMLSSTSL